MSGDCGTCTLCCTLMKVAMEPPKPARQTCGHCTAGGCSIYAERPDVCQGFQCLWLASQQIANYALPPAMRPDRSGVVIDLNAAGTVLVHCERPGSWKREPMRSWLLHHARHTNVILELPIGVELLRKDGSTEELSSIGVDPASGCRVYIRVAAAAAACSEAANANEPIVERISDATSSRGLG